MTQPTTTPRASHASPDCGDATGDVVTVASFAGRAAASDPLIQRSRLTWSSNDFSRIAAGYADGAAEFVSRLSLQRGEPTLDVACGTGNLTLPAARTGASVVGLDIAPNLLDAARAASLRAGLEIGFDEGDAEHLPYPEGRFATVMSMFGVMFAPRHDAALAELLRVARPGGRIALATWIPTGFVGAMLRAHAALVPPPAGSTSPLEWGDTTKLRARLEPHARRVRAVTMTPRTIDLAYPTSPGGVVELFRECYGPSARTYAALDAGGRAALTSELTRLWTERNVGSNEFTRVSAEYLDTLIELE
ncbi:MAG TPA: class I SAM-dependent methyltransferase [Gemmatimonadaceae bacterium]|nr:class I SAM-dependent methyltransferase [Gemmatimonadaceae bacterium]